MTKIGRRKDGQISDQKSRSRESWERGSGAKKKGNPRYTPKRVRRKDGSMTTVYKLRVKPKKK